MLLTTSKAKGIPVLSSDSISEFFKTTFAKNASEKIRDISSPGLNKISRLLEMKRLTLKLHQKDPLSVIKLKRQERVEAESEN